MKFRPKISDSAIGTATSSSTEDTPAVAEHRRRHAVASASTRVEHRGVDVLAEVRQCERLEIGVARLALEPSVELLSVAGRAAPHRGGHQAPEGHEGQEGLVHGAPMLMKPCDDLGSELVTEP